MALVLTPETLAAAYGYLQTTDPFKRWNLPDKEDVVFRVMRTKNLCGQYCKEKGKHVICASSGKIGRTFSLMELMSHEMVHLHMQQSGMSNNSDHGATFHKFAAQICRVHGFDEKLF